jgi:hypothetical protein
MLAQKSYLLSWLIPTLIVVYIVVVLTDGRRRTGMAKSDWLVEHWFLRFCLYYFPVRLVRTAKLDKTKTYVFGMHPHGVIPWTAIVLYSQAWRLLFSGIHVRLLGNMLVFYFRCANRFVQLQLLYFTYQL